MNVSITNSDRADKRFKAVFTDKDGKKVKTTHFGLKNFAKGTFIDHNNNKLKSNYLKRHAPRENWNDMYSAGALSRWILWNKKTLASSISDFKNRFKLK
tara:strand:- start:2931 stop:3227 length:297 start_codon:yes stop_codon:yes gene_type:complete